VQNGSLEVAMVGAPVVDARALLRDRVMVATSSAIPTGLLATVLNGPGTTGLVGIGTTVGSQLRKYKLGHPDIVTGLDPAAYDQHEASCEHPFALFPAKVGPLSLLPRLSLADYVGEALGRYDVVFTPTGLVPVRDGAVLRAVISSANEVEENRVVVTLPAPAGWLGPEGRQVLMDVLRRSRHPVALVVTGQLDPYEDRATADGLIDVLAESGPSVFLHRTDMAAVQALARNALGASIGVSTSLRHTVIGPRVQTRRRKGPKPLPILVPGIDAFHDVDKLQAWFGDAGPACDCCGRLLTDFDRYDPDDVDLVANHNVRSWRQIVDDLVAVRPSDRRSWLKDYRVKVQLAYQSMRTTTRNRTIQPSGGAQTWLKATD
jgi:hypothetical protein